MDKKKYTAEEKVKVLREVLEEKKAVSAVAEERGLHPNSILTWKKQLFEGAATIFAVKRPDITAKAEERKTAALEAELKHKDEIIASLAGENLELKKNFAGRK
jgi:transposase-like protein